MKYHFTLRFIALSLRVVKCDYYSKLRWFETAKYKIVPTRLLSYFFEVNHARKVKGRRRGYKKNAKVISLSKVSAQKYMYKKIRVYYRIIYKGKARR